MLPPRLAPGRPGTGTRPMPRDAPPEPPTTGSPPSGRMSAPSWSSPRARSASPASNLHRVDLDAVSFELRRRFDERMQARERALPASRRAIRACANAIRAIHRGELDLAHRLMDEAKAALDQHPHP